ncbi:MAG: RidA family protein [Deltaproteobacteria bacterium]|nr:RidA family protein [Deltaproteobacteria bacterium]MDE0342046.1 RidA family protein [Deltaproteobacteria bacterium]
MSIEVIHTNKAPEAIGPYEQAIRANGFVYTAGQIALVPETGELVAGGVEEQARRVLDNVTAVLEAAGTSWDKAVKTTIYLSDMADFAAVNAIYESYLGSGKPARTTVAVAGLPKGALVEVDVVALA